MLMQKINYDNDKLFCQSTTTKRQVLTWGRTYFHLNKSCQASEESDNDQINGMVLV